jgi:serine carboxypeptidase-like clade 1
VDSPAGTGFSYDTTGNRTIPSDTIVIRQLHTFLQTVHSSPSVIFFHTTKYRISHRCKFPFDFFSLQWFDEHPQFLPNPFYVAGDSYSGVIIPPLAMKIAEGS